MRMRNPIATLVAAAALAVTAVAPATAQPRAVVVAADAEYPPFNYTDEAGRIVGFDVDVTLAACAAAGLSCSFVAQAWDGLIPGLLVGKYDAISASMVATEARREQVDFTDRLYQMPSQFLVAKGTDFGLDPEGLAGKTVAAQRATVQAEFLEAEYGPKSRVSLYESQNMANLDLAAGRVDALLGEVLALTESFLSTPAGAGFEFRGPEFRFGEGVAIAVRKDDPELRDALNAGLAAILADGTFRELSEQYFGRDIH